MCNQKDIYRRKASIKSYSKFHQVVYIKIKQMKILHLLNVCISMLLYNVFCFCEALSLI